MCLRMVKARGVHAKWLLGICPHWSRSCQIRGDCAPSYQTTASLFFLFFFQTMPPAHATPSNPVFICFFSAVALFILIKLAFPLWLTESWTLPVVFEHNCASQSEGVLPAYLLHKIRVVRVVQLFLLITEGSWWVLMGLGKFLLWICCLGIGLGRLAREVFIVFDISLLYC